MKRSKINRFLSLICALAMVVSATSVPAFADDQPEEPGTVMTEPAAGQTEQDAPVQTPADEPSAEPEQEPEETVEYTFELETAVPEMLHLQTLVSQTAARSMSRKKSCTTPSGKRLKASPGREEVRYLNLPERISQPCQELIRTKFSRLLTRPLTWTGCSDVCWWTVPRICSGLTKLTD